MTTSLGDINDVQGFARKAVNDWLHDHHAYLNTEDREELTSTCVLRIIEVWATYDPTRTHSFRAYAGAKLRHRIIDWYRKRFGDSRNINARPDQIPLADHVPALTNDIDEIISIRSLTPRAAKAYELVVKPRITNPDLDFKTLAAQLGWTTRRLRQERELVAHELGYDPALECAA